MTLKSYFSPTVEAAMAQAAKELGPEAMLVYSREAPAESRSWGRYEVVFGWEMNHSPAVEPTSAPIATESERSVRPVPKPVSESNSSAEVRFGKGVEKQALMASAKSSDRAVHRISSRGAARQPEPWRERLLELGFSASLSETLAQRFEEEGLATSGKGNERISPQFWTGLEQWIPLAGASDMRRSSALVLAGPSGVGKTTALAKLAFRSITTDRRPVHLVATDGDRICGGQWLERFARLTDVPFSMAESLAALEALVRAEPPGRLLLIEASSWLNTAGAGWSAFRRRNSGVQVHLMLPTPYRPQETRSVVDRYHGLEPDRIIAARMDESLQAGAVCSLAAELGTPISFITSGDAIPDGLEHASIERLMRVIGVESGGVA